MNQSIEGKKTKKQSVYFISTALIMVGLIFAFRYSLYQKAEKIFNPKPPTREVALTIRDSQFTPDNIKVVEGDQVKITAKNYDEEDHGIAIDEYRLWRSIPHGETVIIEFLANKKGTYKLYCSVSCSGHITMRGNLIVE